jgi:hypothetical protein
MKRHYKKFFTFVALLLMWNITLQAQSLRNDMVSAIGGNYQSPDAEFTIHQSIGQSSVIGVFTHSSFTLSQGYLRGISLLTKEIETPFEVIPFPNAFADLITFRFVTDHEEETLFQIYDMKGRQVFENTLVPIDNKVLLDLDFLANGLYLAILTSGTRTVHRRIIKNK